MSLGILRNLWEFLLLLLLIAATSDCQRERNKDDYSTQNREELKQRFKKLTLEEQYQLFIKSRTRKGFPSYILMENMSDNDVEDYPFFQKKLREAVGEDEIEGLTSIFIILSGHGILQGKTDIWDLLKTKVSSVKTLETRSKLFYWLYEIEMDIKYKSFFFRPESEHFPPEQRRKEFHSFPQEAQLELYLYAMSIEPPLTEFGEYLADQGTTIIPMLISVLNTDYYERCTRKLLFLIELLAMKGVLCGRTDVIKAVKDRIDLNPNDEGMHHSYQRILEAMDNCTSTRANH